MKGARGGGEVIIIIHHHNGQRPRIPPPFCGRYTRIMIYIAIKGKIGRGGRVCGFETLCGKTTIRGVIREGVGFLSYAHSRARGQTSFSRPVAVSRNQTPTGP